MTKAKKVNSSTMKLVYGNIFQDKFLETFGSNVNIIYSIPKENSILLEVYPLAGKTNKSMYLPFKFRNYKCKYIWQ